MSQELTPAQLERIKQQRAQRFKEMGLPANAGQIIDVPVENQRYVEPQQPVQDNYEQQFDYNTPTQNVEIPSGADISMQIQEQIAQERALRQSAMYTAPRDKFNALEAIRKGAKRQEFNTFIKAESNAGKGNQLPEPKVGKRKPVRPGQPQEKSANAIPVEGSKIKRSAEADMLEGLFTDNSSGISMRSTSSIEQGDLISVDENYSNIGPTFDPISHLKAKAAEKGINVDFSKKQQTQQNNQVFQSENQNSQLNQMLIMMENLMKNQKNNFDLSTLKEMMEITAKRVAEETMKKVLKEYVESQKKKQTNIFEVINEEKQVVKIDNKLYKLTPVTIKK